jgi:hypothetical protein
LTGQFEAQATAIPAKTRDAKKSERPATTQTKNASVVQFFLETKRVAATQPSFSGKAQPRATGLLPMCAAVPPNKWQHFRPAGTRVALPGTKRHSQKTESSVQDVFSTPCIPFREREQFA